MKNDNKGFSLIELIVVIAIMAILVGVMAPQVTKYIDRARESNDVQTMQAVYTAVYTTLLDPMVTKNTPGATYSLPTTAPTADPEDFNYAVYEIVGHVAGDIKFKSKAAINGGATIPTGSSLTIAIANSTDVTVSVGKLKIDKDGFSYQ